MVEIRFGSLVSENVLKMVRAKRPAILPLREARATSFANTDPTMATDGLPRPGVGLLKPRNHQRRFRLELAVRYVVIRQSKVERILFRDERYRNVVAASARVRGVRAAVIRCPIQIPRTLVVRDWIIPASF